MPTTAITHDSQEALITAALNAWDRPTWLSCKMPAGTVGGSGSRRPAIYPHRIRSVNADGQTRLQRVSTVDSGGPRPAAVHSTARPRRQGASRPAGCESCFGDSVPMRWRG